MLIIQPNVRIVVDVIITPLLIAAKMSDIASNNIPEKPNITAKELALYIGVPVATLCVAGGIYYYYSKKTSPGKDESDGTSVAVSTPQVVPDSGASVSSCNYLFLFIFSFKFQTITF